MSTVFVYGAGASDVSWEEARAAVRSDLWRASTQGMPDDVIDRALHAALRRVEGERRWSWLEEIRGTLTAQSDTDALTPPVSMRSVVSLAYLSGTRSYTILNRAPLPLVRAASHQNHSGWPTCYALNGGAIILDSVVITGAQFELIFKQGVPRDLADAIIDPPVTLTRESVLVIADACRHIALTRLKNETEASRHAAAYDVRLMALMDEEDEERGDEMSGFVVPDTSYHQAARGRFNA